jgi:hypothetical protein
MSRRSRNPRRAYDAEGREIAPMMLADMLEAMHTTRVLAYCGDCLHEGKVNADSLPVDLPVPDVALRLRCSACGSKNVTTRPDLSEMYASWYACDGVPGTAPSPRG